MAQYTADVRFIASIYPGKLPVIRRSHGPSLQSQGAGAQRSTRYELKPVERGEKPCVIPVYDSFELILDVLSISTNQDRSGHKPRIEKPVPVDSIVSDLLKEWTGGLYNVPEGAAPGVIEIFPYQVELKKWAEAKYKPEALPGPNKSEMDRMMSMQTAYFEYWFSQGEMHHKRNQWDAISDPMRLGAKWLGRDVLWANPEMYKNTDNCPWCAATIPSIAIVCPQCSRQVKKTPHHLLDLAGQAPAPQQTA